MKLKRSIVSIGLAVGMTLGMAAPALAAVVNVGGGTWNYGTSFQLPIHKKAWSDYMHRSRVHGSNVVCGSETKDSGWVGKGTWSKASARCGAGEGTAAYYRLKK